jgi:hypothetical protein
MDLDLILKVVTVIGGWVPAIRTRIISRFGRLYIEPINDQAINIFYFQRDKNRFFVKIHFHLKSLTTVEILNIDLDYDSGHIPIEKHGWDGQNGLRYDSYGRLTEKIVLAAGELHHIAMQVDFSPGHTARDFGEVSLSFEVNFPACRAIAKKSVKYTLAGGGELQPGGGQAI